MRTIYRTDKTLCGFFSAVFSAYTDKNALICSESVFQTRLDDTFVFIESDKQKAKRVFEKLRAIDRKCLGEIDSVLRTSYSDREQVAFEYLRLIVKKNEPAREKLSDECVRHAILYEQRVSKERERLLGFLRFQETTNGIFYAACSPDHDVVELLLPFFAGRFKNVPFVIHDIKRKLAGASDGKNLAVFPASEAEIILSPREYDFAALWKKYYRTAAIPERKNKQQQDRAMPFRYRKFMSETQ